MYKKSIANEIEIENTEELDNLEYCSSDGKPIFEKVRVTKKDFSVYELYRKYTTGKLILDVDFQRKLVWDSKQQCELIESILMGLPLPIFYFKQQDDAKYIVVDGKQRLAALFSFLSDEFELKNLHIMPFLEGKRYKDLVGDLGIYQSQLEDYQIYSHVILPPTPDQVLFDIFDRVNRGGTKLNKQEIRNALYHGIGLEMINHITKSDEFIRATKIKIEKDTRMKGAYLITRFLSFYLLYDRKLGKEYSYDGSIDNLIEKTLTYLNRCNENILTEYFNLTKNSLSMAYECIGEGVFRKDFNASKPINMNIFEIVLYFFANNKSNDLRLLRQKIYTFITDKKFLDTIGNSRDNKQRVKCRYDQINEMIKGINND